jgi:hypothetical protein
MQPEGAIASNANAATESLILMLGLGFSYILVFAPERKHAFSGRARRYATLPIV